MMGQSARAVTRREELDFKATSRRRRLDYDGARTADQGYCELLGRSTSPYDLQRHALQPPSRPVDPLPPRRTLPKWTRRERRFRLFSTGKGWACRILDARTLRGLSSEGSSFVFQGHAHRHDDQGHRHPPWDGDHDRRDQLRRGRLRPPHPRQPPRDGPDQARNMNSGTLIEKRLRSVDQIEVPYVETKEYEYLYSVGRRTRLHGHARPTTSSASRPRSSARRCSISCRTARSWCSTSTTSRSRSRSPPRST